MGRHRIGPHSHYRKKYSIDMKIVQKNKKLIEQAFILGLIIGAVSAVVYYLFVA